MNDMKVACDKSDLTHIRNKGVKHTCYCFTSEYLKGGFRNTLKLMSFPITQTLWYLRSIVR